MKRAKAMTMRSLASQLALSEGRKHQASIGDVREILALLSDMLWAECYAEGRQCLLTVLMKNGKRRALAKPKRKCKR